MLTLDDITWVTEVEVLRHGDVIVTEKDVTVTCTVRADATHIEVTALNPIFVAHMDLLVVIKALDPTKALLFRTAFSVDTATHNYGPFEVFSDVAVVTMQTPEVRGVGESFYTRAFPRMWTGCSLVFPTTLIMC
jgi:hypothetical protein